MNNLKNNIRVFTVLILLIFMFTPIIWNATMPRIPETDTNFSKNIEFSTQGGMYHMVRDSYQLCLTYCNYSKPNDTIWTALLKYPTNEDINWIDFEFDIPCYYAPDNYEVKRYINVCNVQVLQYKNLSNNKDSYIKFYQLANNINKGIYPKINNTNPWLQ